METSAGQGEHGTGKSVKGSIRKIPSESVIRLWRNFLRQCLIRGLEVDFCSLPFRKKLYRRSIKNPNPFPIWKIWFGLYAFGARGEGRTQARALHRFQTGERAQAGARRGQKARQAGAAPAADARHAHGRRRLHRGNAADLRGAITETLFGFPARRAWPERTPSARTRATKANAETDRAAPAGRRRADSAPV